MTFEPKLDMELTTIIAWTLGIFLFGPAALVILSMAVLVVVAGVTAVCDAVASAVRRLK